MDSIFKKEVVFKVDAHNLSTLIGNLYGREPEIEASCELGHDDMYEIGVFAEEFDQELFDQWKAKPTYSRSEIDNVMSKLCADGHIEEGTYIIETC